MGEVTSATSDEAALAALMRRLLTDREGDGMGTPYVSAGPRLLTVDGTWPLSTDEFDVITRVFDTIEPEDTGDSERRG